MKYFKYIKYFDNKNSWNFTTLKMWNQKFNTIFYGITDSAAPMGGGGGGSEPPLPIDKK